MDRRRFLWETTEIVGGMTIAVWAGSNIADASQRSLRTSVTSGDDGTAAENTPSVQLYLPRWKDDFARLDSDGKLRFDYRRAYERLVTLRRQSEIVSFCPGNARDRCNSIDRIRMTTPRTGEIRCDNAPNGDPFGQWLMRICERLDFHVVFRTVHDFFPASDHRERFFC